MFKILKAKPMMVMAVILLHFLPSQLFADQINLERFNISLSIDDQGRISPDVFIPHYWAKNFYSGCGFRNREESDTSKVEGFSDSRFSVDTVENRIRLNILSWQSRPEKIVYSIGGELEYYTIDKTEFGYFHLPVNLGDDWVAFDNKIEMTILKPILHGDLKWSSESEMFNIRAGINISPASYLDVAQETRTKPIVENTVSNESSAQQDASYELTFDLLFKTNYFADIGVVGSYEFIPMKYDLALLFYDNAAKSYYFKPSPIELDQTTLFGGLKIILNTDYLGSVKPAAAIGYERIKTKTKNNDSNSSSRTLFLLGFEKKF